jgi:L-erythro-3,5-diaminohexanoate dehydrogenase
MPSEAATDRPAAWPASSPLGLHRVLEPPGVLPQAAWKLDPRPELAPDEVRIRVQRLNLDAASYRQLIVEHHGDAAAMRAAVAGIIRDRGKMHNPVTGSGGMLVGVVDEAGPRSPVGLRRGERVATLVSLTLTPLAVGDGLARWDGRSEQVPCEGHAILSGRAIAAVLPDDLPDSLALAVLDVCGAPALTERVVRSCLPAAEFHDRGARPAHSAGNAPRSWTQPASGVARGDQGTGDSGDAPRRPLVAVIGASGKSGCLSAAAARRAGAGRVIGVVPDQAEAAVLRAAGGTDSAASGARAPAAPLADEIVVADARDAVALAAAVEQAGGPADVTVVCVDVTGCEGGAILATAQGGTVIFFSMATSFTAAALTAEGMGADVTMLIGNGYVPGHAELALDLARSVPAARSLLARRVSEDRTEAAR